MKFILMGLIKRFTKEAGRSPNPVELTNLKKNGTRDGKL
jgi:hypothetical protein